MGVNFGRFPVVWGKAEDTPAWVPASASAPPCWHSSCVEQAHQSVGSSLCIYGTHPAAPAVGSHSPDLLSPLPKHCSSSGTFSTALQSAVCSCSRSSEDLHALSLFPSLQTVDLLACNSSRWPFSSTNIHFLFFLPHSFPHCFLIIF